MPPKLTDEDAALVIKLLEQDHKPPEVAALVGCYVATVYRIAQNHRIFDRPYAPSVLTLGRPKKLSEEIATGLERFFIETQRRTLLKLRRLCFRSTV